MKLRIFHHWDVNLILGCLMCVACNAFSAQNTADLGFHEVPSSFIVSGGSDGMVWDYTFTDPGMSSPNWNEIGFDSSSWLSSPGGFYRYDFPSAAWHIEDVDGTYVRIKNHWLPDTYLHTEYKGTAPYNDPSSTRFYNSPQAGPIESYWWSAMWKVETLSDGRVRFQNRWDPDAYLHVEHGRLEVSVAQSNWESAKWTIEDTEFPIGSSEPRPIYLKSYWGNYANVKSGIAADMSGLDYSIGSTFRLNYLRDSQTTFWSPDNEYLWLRSQFTLSSGQDTDLMLWARWFNVLEVYINGVPAVDVELFSFGYRHLGISDAARASLHTDGTPNLIAVKVRGKDHAYFDMGLTQNSDLSDLPVSSGGTEFSNEIHQQVVQPLKKYMEQQGISAGVIALYHDGDLVLSKGIGYQDKSFTTVMPHDGVMRLASNDKVVTKDAINKLIADGTWTPLGALTLNTKVFPLLRQYGLVEMSGFTRDSRADDITIGHLLNHRGWVREMPNLATHDVANGSRDQFYDDLGVTPDTLTAYDNVRWVYSQPLTNTPGTVVAGSYSSSGYMILRYVVDQLVSDSNNYGLSLEEFLQSEMFSVSGDQDIYIAKERLADRQASEPWYNDNIQSYDRWMELDAYHALATSAPAFVKYANSYPASGWYYGSMTGSWTWTASVTNSNTGKDVKIALMFNTGGYFDPISHDLASNIQNLSASALQGYSPTTYQMEDGSFSSGSIDSNHSGYTGSGFVNTLNSTGVWSEVTVTVPAASQYDLVLRYANGSSSRPMNVFVSGVLVGQLGGSGTGAWNNWQTESLVNVALNSGTNTIRFVATLSGGTPNLDNLTVQ